ncbi:T9SS type A sorting domain-containing protein [Aureispira anguillae]|uniref:T9SS type A sorting domain-containing protein n=1 Tax=Aureispira anguillae TaxID=2864201 RepID=A0A915YCG8_9BACT|nr:T9SS type A sorting domain-containing protein [Aureispira anguillae]BDS10516.1 T9SS type A sorting domain-containing protein [Aureispira anguillae]
MVLKYALLALILFLGLQKETFATHIVGGEMTYDCLGNNQYRINLKIYRDCDSGIPWFDNPASIGIFNAQTNGFISTVSIPLDTASNDTLSLNYPDTCLPPNLCLHATVYSTVVTLPVNSSGYVISYQRCCRNYNIVNIIDPNNTGMTITTEITAAALLSCNSSPKFNNEVPLHLTVNDTFSVDLSATDADGDSLVYVFYAPFDGGTSGNPLPIPPAAPPYNSVSHHAPYTYQSPIGNTLFNWNPSTGELSGTPTISGTFLVGFSILEYNTAGVLLSKTYKDFTIQLTPMPCNLINSLNKTTITPTIQLFPNPTHNELTIETGTEQEVELRLYSIQGQELLYQSFRKGTTIHLATWPKGVYFLDFTSNNQRTIKRIVKQ